VITARVASDAELLLLAPVRGLAAEAPRVVEELTSFAPEAVGLGASAEEMQGLTDYFVLSEAEPVVPLSPNELHEVRGLTRFGEVRVPNPSFVAAIGWSLSRSVPLAALDPNEERSASLFAEHIGYVELVRRTVREHRAGRAPPTPSSADAFAVAWDGRVAGGRGSRRLAAARDRHLAEETRRLSVGRHRIAVLVDRERFDGIRAALPTRESR
jgi:hypothetical protein